MATLNAISANAISAIAFFIHVSSVVSIDLGAPIVGCSAVGCPPLETNASLPNCRVANYSNSSMIGVAALKSSISSDLTWTQAVSITPNVNYNSDPALPPGNSYSWDFFFGAPKELNLANRTDIGACAFIFTNISRQAVFPGVTSNRTVTGTCSDAFTQECVNAITTRSLTVMDDAIGSGYTGSSPICDLLAAEWSGTVPGPCPSYLGGVTTISMLLLRPCFSTSKPAYLSIYSWKNRIQRPQRASPHHCGPKQDIQLLAHPSQVQHTLEDPKITHGAVPRHPQSRRRHRTFDHDNSNSFLPDNFCKWNNTFGKHLAAARSTFDLPQTY